MDARARDQWECCVGTGEDRRDAQIKRCLCYILKSGLTEVAYLMQTWIGAGVRAVEEKAVISDVYHNLFLKQVHIYYFRVHCTSKPSQKQQLLFYKGLFLC